MEMSRRAGPDPWRTALTQLMRQAKVRGEVDPSLDPESIAQVLVSAWQGLVPAKGLRSAGGFVQVLGGAEGPLPWGVSNQSRALIPERFGTSRDAET